MKRAFALFALVATVHYGSAAERKIEPAKFGWHADYSEAKAEAKRTGKPMMLVFRCEP